MFIDKDGTLIRNIPFNADPRLTTLLDGAANALNILQRCGYLLLVITNQPGIALGLTCEVALHNQYLHLSRLLRKQQVTLNGMYYCPHHPLGTGIYGSFCLCRKPSPGMLIRAAADWNINLRQSWMVGDILNDTEAGNKAGCRTILLDQGNETEWLPGKKREPLHICHHWSGVAQFISSNC